MGGKMGLGNLHKMSKKVEKSRNLLDKLIGSSYHFDIWVMSAKEKWMEERDEKLGKCKTGQRIF